MLEALQEMPVVAMRNCRLCVQSVAPRSSCGRVGNPHDESASPQLWSRSAQNMPFGLCVLSQSCAWEAPCIVGVAQRALLEPAVCARSDARVVLEFTHGNIGSRSETQEVQFDMFWEMSTRRMFPGVAEADLGLDCQRAYWSKHWDSFRMHCARHSTRRSKSRQ